MDETDASVLAASSAQGLVHSLDNRGLLKFILRDTHRLIEGVADIEQHLNRQVGVLERRIMSLHRQHVREPAYAFPYFSKLPPELRQRIWDLAIPRRYVRAVRLSDRGGVLQRPPDVAQVCREARAVATRHGGMWKTSYQGYPQWTWFQADRDVVIWNNTGDLGDLPSVAKTIVVPGSSMNFGLRDTLRNLIRRDGFRNLETIYIETGDKFTMVDKHWSPKVVTELFGFDKILLPDMESWSAGCEKNIFSLLKREKHSANTPPDAFSYWCNNMDWRDSMNWCDDMDWCDYMVDVDSDVDPRDDIYSWACKTRSFNFIWAQLMAELTPGLGLQPAEDGIYPLNSKAMRPFSSQTWREHFELSAPRIIPTCVFALVDDMPMWDNLAV
ncbi:hypothetical protein DL768_002997 [Monosporascus sp. mg162]|nr:hypothetical protein DL768_002997 [Monosporascus sp. mg162]